MALPSKVIRSGPISGGNNDIYYPQPVAILDDYSSLGGTPIAAAAAITDTASHQIVAAGSTNSSTAVRNLNIVNSGATGAVYQIYDGANVIYTGYVGPNSESKPGTLSSSPGNALSIKFLTAPSGAYVSGVTSSF